MVVTATIILTTIITTPPRVPFYLIAVLTTTPSMSEGVAPAHNQLWWTALTTPSSESIE